MNITNVNIDNNFALVLTDAPEAYDYGYTSQLGVADLYPKALRVVSMPPDMVEYQRGRYMSGMYIACPVEAP